MTFTASVQFNDYKGTVALDRSDSLVLSDKLKDSGLLRDGELVAAIRLNIGENHGDEIETVAVVAYVLEADCFVEAPEVVRAVETEMRWAEFFSFFKRFDLVFTFGDRDLTNTRVDYGD